MDHLTYQHTKLIWILPPTTAVAEFQSTLVCVVSFQEETKITTKWLGCPQNMQQLAENCNIISSYCFPLNLLFHHALYYRIIHSTDGRMACSSVHFTLIYLHLNFFYSLISCCCSCRFFFQDGPLSYITLHTTLIRDQIGQGLGFSIAGGRGSPPYKDGCDGIFISRITEGSLAHRDGKIMVGDRVMAVSMVPI